MRKIQYITVCCLMTAFLSSCSQDIADNDTKNDVITTFSVSSQIVPMTVEGQQQTRINDEGDAFVTDDRIRLKMVTPYDIEAAGRGHDSEFGESTWGGSIDNYFLLRWDGTSKGEGYTGWTTDGFSRYDLDINGDGNYGDGAPGLQHLSQQTPYVYTANTWDRGVAFKTTSTWRVQFKSTFYADQSIQENFHASDLLWAQTITQTCTDQVTLSFHHVMSELLITIPAEFTNAVVNLKGVPNVDQQEFVVGDCYANAYVSYGKDLLSYSNICYTSDKAMNGKVLGISYISGNTLQLKKMEDIKDNISGEYTAYHAGGQSYRLIIPPMTYTEEMKLVIHYITSDGSAKIYEYPLGARTFEPGMCYPVTITNK